MKITRSDEERLVIVDFPWMMGLAFLAFPSGFLWQTWISHAQPTESLRDREIGLVLAVVFFAVGGYLMQRTLFSFDKRLRTLEWSRTGILGCRRGSVSFDQIKGARVTSMRDNRGRPEYRAVVATEQGDLPLANMFWRGTDDKYWDVCDAINQALGKSYANRASLEDKVRDLVANGDTFGAIALVRRAKKCSLAEAKKFVETQT